MSSSPEEFVPEKMIISTKRTGRRRGKGAGGGGGRAAETGGDDEDDGGGKAHSSAFSDSVVFHDEQLFDQQFDGPILDADDCALYDEIDGLYPHEHEGGKVVSDRHDSVIASSYSHSHSNGYGSLMSASRSNTSSMPQSMLGSTLLTDYESLAESSNDGTLAEMIARMEEHMKSSATSISEASHEDHGIRRHGSIVGGRILSEMSFEEQRELFAPNRSPGSLVIDLDSDAGADELDQSCKHRGGKEAIAYYSPVNAFVNAHDDKIVSSVDWSSLSKSCKLAKTAFRDSASGQNVVKNMFMSHLRPLTAVLTLFARRHCGRTNQNEEPVSLAVIKAHTTEAKRALQFALSCLALPCMEDAQPGQKSAQSSNEGDEVEIYRIARQLRQELQEAVVKGFTPEDEHGEFRASRHYYGLQIPLVEIIHSDRSCQSFEDGNTMPVALDDDKRAEIVSSIELGKQRVRVLAARLLCNIVTDSPLAAEIVLRDVPFSPNPDLIEMRMTGLVLGSRERANRGIADNNVIFWSDLVVTSAKVHTSDVKGGRGDLSEDREVLDAVAAALHNLLTSLEARESLLELVDEMKRREMAKKRHEEHNEAATLRQKGCQIRDSFLDEEEHHSKKPIDLWFEVASDGILLNGLLRSILPAKAILIQSAFGIEHKSLSRPKFISPVSPEDVSDSATEWITLILERIASRGLLQQMLRSAGGMSNSVTPEQVILVSCIRQAVDAYHSTGETGGSAKGMAVTTRPHPLWGRADHSAGGQSSSTSDSRTAVPVLLSLANELEEIRLRADALRQGQCAELYDGEKDCTTRIIADLCDILALSLGRHAGHNNNGSGNMRRSKCFIADARSVLGRETSLISSCCKDLGRILDRALADNAGRKARELMLSPQDQQTAIMMVRLIGNIVYQCRYNQDILRVTPIPVLEVEVAASKSASSKLAFFNATPRTNNGLPIERTGLHVILSATSLAHACFTLREWCIVAIRNAVEGNDANAETVRRLEANQVLSDTPELRQLGVKIDMDEKGNVRVKRRAPGQEPSDSDTDKIINWA